MSVSISTLLLAIAVGSRPPCGELVEELKRAYLYEPGYYLDGIRRGDAVEYEPQAGDLLFFTDDLWYWHLGYKLALTGAPYHCAIVVELPNGDFATFESGPNDTLKIEMCPLRSRLQSYDGLIHIRRRAKPLTAEQSKLLNDFALSQDGKRYGLLRLGAQITVLRSRGPLRTYFVGKAKGPTHSSFTCSEAVMEALVAAELLNRDTARPGATYPRDMFYDKSINIYLNRHFTLSPDWHKPQLWTVTP